MRSSTHFNCWPFSFNRHSSWEFSVLRVPICSLYWAAVSSCCRILALNSVISASCVKQALAWTSGSVLSLAPWRTFSCRSCILACRVLFSFRCCCFIRFISSACFSCCWSFDCRAFLMHSTMLLSTDCIVSMIVWSGVHSSFRPCWVLPVNSASYGRSPLCDTAHCQHM